MTGIVRARTRAAMRLPVILLAIASATAVVAQDDFAEGQRLYGERCVACHERQHVALQTVNTGQRTLREAVNKMAQRAGLDYQDANEVIFYLEAVRTGRAKLPVRNPPPAEKTSVPATTAQFAAAQKFFTAGCVSCHAHKHLPIQPTKFTPANLKLWLDKMGPIAKFTADQTAQVGAYLEAVRTGKATLPAGTSTD